MRFIISAGRAFTVVHCCALSVPFGIIKGAGADAAGCDLSKLGPAGEDGLAEAVEAGLGILAGAIPATPSTGRPRGSTGPAAGQRSRSRR